MNFDVIVTGPLGVNCVLVSDDMNVVVFDPGGHAADIAEHIEKSGMKPVAVVNTHGHFDHVGAVKELTDKYNIPFYMHGEDEFLLSQANRINQMYGLGKLDEPSVTKYLEDGDKLEFGSIAIDVIHTPGHTPGGCCFYIKELNLLITGDTLFMESVGRADFPYSDGESLINAISEKLFVFDDGVKVCPGHGAFTTIGHEKLNNPYV